VNDKKKMAELAEKELKEESRKKQFRIIKEAIKGELEKLEEKKRIAEAEKKKLTDKVNKLREKRLEEERQIKALERQIYKNQRPQRLLNMSKMLIKNYSFKPARRNLDTIIKEYPKSPEAKEAKTILDKIKDEM